LKLIVDLIYEGGLSGMRYSISDTAEYGDYTRGSRVIDDRVREEMRRILSEVRSGEFAKEWVLEARAGFPQFEALRAQGRDHLIERIGGELRQMMPWLRRPEAPDA
jgi:ketol-acid reductoisomerase